MSLDSIVNVTITSQSVQIAQVGFGMPLIAGSHNAWSDRVREYRQPSEMLADGFTTQDKLYLAATKLKSQSPCVKSFKIGRRTGQMADDLNAICEEDCNFYGLLLDTSLEEDVLAAAQWAESKQILLGVDIHDVKSGMGKHLKENSFTRTYSVYHPDDKTFAAAALMGKLFPTDPGTATWAFKTLAGVPTYPLTASDSGALDSNNVNRYARIKDIGVTLHGKTSSGEYIDVIRGIDWLHARLQERIFVLLMKNQKIPYTDKGVDLVRCEIMVQLKEAIAAGILAAMPEPAVSAPKVADISDLDKAKRLLPNVHFSGRLEGAIHAIEIKGVVSL